MKREATVALRWVIPFLRVAGADLADLGIAERSRIALRDVADPAARVGHGAFVRWLEATVQKIGDPCLGLRAGERSEVGDFDPLEFAVRTCATLREAIACSARHMHLMHGAQEVRLVEASGFAKWELRITDGVPQPPAANDFALTSALVFARRNMGSSPGVLREVHFRHPVATSAADYARIFEGARIELGAPHNALVYEVQHLDTPMAQTHVGLRAAFELHASDMLERLRATEPLEARLRALLVEQLGAGDVTMGTVARKLAVSAPTLRRRLQEQNTTFSALLSEVRYELAERYLAEDSLAIGQVAGLLGFAHTQAFYKAFRRWSDGVTPVSFRKRATELGAHP